MPSSLPFEMRIDATPNRTIETVRSAASTLLGRDLGSA